MEHLCSADKRLAVIITEIGRFSLKIKKDSFQALIEAIIYQQLNGSAANSIYNRFLAYYENQIPTPEQIISSSDLRTENSSWTIKNENNISQGSCNSRC